MKKTIGAIALVIASTLAFTGCGSAGQPGDADLGGKDNPVKIGIMGPEIQYDYLKTTAEAAGVYIEYVTFNDYNQPNPAVETGELDLNQFQHILYLGGYNVESGKPLVALQATAIYPLGLYSKQFKTVAEIPQDGQVAIPNDETNQARAIAVLVQQGLLKVKEGTDLLYSTPLDVDEAASKVKVVPVSAEQTPRSLDDPNVAAAIVNNNYALDADLNPSDAIGSDDPANAEAAPYINVWAGKAEAKDNPVIAKILEIAASQEWKDKLQEQAQGSAVVVDDRNYDQLQEILADVEAQIQAHK
jgi:D-methionine transport system substrate-binding protein